MVNGPECLVKMAQVAESAVAANLFDRHVGDGQLRDGIAHTEFIDQFGERLVEMDTHDSVHMVDIPIAQIDKARHAPGKMLGAVVFLNGIEEPQGDLGIIGIKAFNDALVTDDRVEKVILTPVPASHREQLSASPC